MVKKIVVAMGVMVALCGLVVGMSVAAERKQPAAAKNTAKGAKANAWIDQNMQGWPDKTKQVASEVIGKYGPPAENTDSMLIWKDAGPWKRTVLYRDEVQHNFPMPHKDVLEQFVNYEVPVDKFTDLAKFDGSVIAERTKGVMSARCDKEAANFLAINLANDVAKGNKSVADARQYYTTAIQGMLNGKMDPYMQGLKFERPGQAAGDPDQATIDKDKIKQAKQMKQAKQEQKSATVR